jgi:hypothetical protein
MARIGVSNVVEASLTRPANTTAYAAGDAVSNSASAPVPLTFANAVRESGGVGVVVSATIATNSNESTKPDLELWLFDTIPTAINDNAAFVVSDADILNVVGVFAFATSSWRQATAGTGGTSFAQGAWLASTPPPMFRLAAGTALYGLLVVRNAYTPISGEVFHIKLGISQ